VERPRDIEFEGRLDPELAAALSQVPMLDLRDIPRARRERAELAARNKGGWTLPTTVAVADQTAAALAPRAHELRLRTYRPADGTSNTTGLVWIHGGGHVMNEPESDDPLICRFVEATGCAVVSVDWRHAPEHPYPAAIDDCYAGLLWTAEHAAELGVHPTRLVVGGASSGGGLAAGLALLARDVGEVALHGQLLLYPMLDDRSVTYSSRAITHPRVWNAESNRLAWIAYLGADAGGVVATYAAPARATDLRGLPMTWIATAELDLFVDENIDYARRLMQAGVPTELHVYPAAMHGFDVFAPTAAVSRRLKDDLVAAFVRMTGA
jgi:acetyl esterase/lipase